MLGHYSVRTALPLSLKRDFKLVAQRGRNPPAVQETRAPSLGREGALERGMAIRSSVPPAEPRGEGSRAGCSPRGRRVRPDGATGAGTHTSLVALLGLFWLRCEALGC